MLHIGLVMLINSAFLLLRLGGAEGSFLKPLNAEEERAYVDAFLKGDMEARNKLVEHNLRLVAHIIKKYYTQDCEQDDLISIGTIGLIKGISTYDPSKGVRLATYASRCIENEILMHFRKRKKSAGDVSLSDSIESDGDGNSLSLMDVVFVEDDMLEQVSRQESSTALYRHMRECLTEREREIVTARYGLGGGAARTQREIAAECGISRSYVAHRA